MTDLLQGQAFPTKAFPGRRPFPGLLRIGLGVIGLRERVAQDLHGIDLTAVVLDAPHGPHGPSP